MRECDILHHRAIAPALTHWPRTGAMGKGSMHCSLYCPYYCKFTGVGDAVHWILHWAAVLHWNSLLIHWRCFGAVTIGISCASSRRTTYACARACPLGVPSGCQSSSPRSACGSSVPGRSKAGLWRCRTAPAPVSTRRVRQTGQSIAAGAFPAHAVRMKIRRTTRLMDLPFPHHRLPPSRRDLRLYRVR